MIAALAAVMLARPWARTALYWGAVSLAIMLFLLSLWRAGERAWRMADGGWRMAEPLETTEKVNDVQPEMPEPAARRPRDRDELARRLRDGHS